MAKSKIGQQVWVTFDHNPTFRERLLISHALGSLGYYVDHCDGDADYVSADGKTWQLSFITDNVPVTGMR